MRAPVLMLADANVFLRFLRNDHPQHSAASKKLIEEAAAGTVILRVPEIVVADIFYTLTAPLMKIPRPAAARQLAALLHQAGMRGPGIWLCSNLPRTVPDAFAVVSRKKSVSETTSICLTPFGSV